MQINVIIGQCRLQDVSKMKVFIMKLQNNLATDEDPISYLTIHTPAIVINVDICLYMG